jgi:hypothetical protein
MKTNLKVALSAIALAALVAAPAAAKSRTQEHSNAQAPVYLNDQVVLDGKVIGADPDAHIRGAIRRDGVSYRY